MASGEPPILVSVHPKPSEIIAGGQAALTCEPEEEILPYVLETVAEHLVMYASDYPHWDCKYPESVRIVARASCTVGRLARGPGRFEDAVKATSLRLVVPRTGQRAVGERQPILGP